MLIAQQNSQGSMWVMVAAAVVWLAFVFMVVITVNKSAPSDSRVVKWFFGRDGVQLILGSLIFIAAVSLHLIGKLQDPLSQLIFAFAGFIFGRVSAGADSSGGNSQPGAPKD